MSIIEALHILNLFPQNPVQHPYPPTPHENKLTLSSHIFSGNPIWLTQALHPIHTQSLHILKLIHRTHFQNPHPQISHEKKLIYRVLIYQEGKYNLQERNKQLAVKSHYIAVTFSNSVVTYITPLFAIAWDTNVLA
ncbi:hypothetical protein HNY73_017607 [Argiope bruennichi]|uniref:Uncharacterized protein n=1 Tax=Argiope bruennichi TaxID=94029 RepID=A0A8T0EBL7_ARGBR|nr:hypothetical protein HNY73_017607 [Argiope bruennichi]